MIALPLTAAELSRLLDDLRFGPYLMRTVVHMLDRDHRILEDLSDRFLDGQVDAKLEGRVTTRTLSITLADPRREVALDGKTASAGALFYDKMLAVSVELRGPRLGRWISVPVFCGPITNAARTGWQAQATAQGKERLATAMLWESHTYKRGLTRVGVVRDLLQRTGESTSRIALPDSRARLPKDLAFGRTDRAWPLVRDLTDGLNRQGLYDGRGDFRMRIWPEDPVVTFRDGTGGTILTEPEVSYDSWSGFNGVWVRGPARKDGTRHEAVVWLPRAHPLSPWSLARGGVPQRLAYIEESNTIRSDAEATTRAETVLRRLVRETVNVSLDVMPNWLLEPGDIYAVHTTAVGRIEQQLTEFSLPLTIGVGMSLGATKVLRRPTRTPRSRTKTRTRTRSLAGGGAITRGR